jgi:protein-disulfide isomerase
MENQLKGTSAPSSDKKTSKKNDYFELRIPRFAKVNYFSVFIVILLMIMAFIIGSFYTKIRYLEQAGTNIPSTTVQQALVKYAQQVGLNLDQFKTCINKGKYLSQLTADTTEATRLGVNATPAFFVNGIFVGGAFPYESFKEIIDKELAGTATENYLDYSPALQQAYENPQGKGFDPVVKAVPVGNAPVRGANNAKVTIVEYSDFQCPFCERAFPTMNKILQDYKGKVRLAYKLLPLSSIHPNAQISALASVCAKEQNKFWEYHDKLFDNQQEWSPLPQPTNAI